MPRKTRLSVVVLVATWAADCPAAKNGGAVEIRPTVPMMASDMQ